MSHKFHCGRADAHSSRVQSHSASDLLDASLHRSKFRRLDVNMPVWMWSTAHQRYPVTGKMVVELGPYAAFFTRKDFDWLEPD
jgi:hypothetical protein